MFSNRFTEGQKREQEKKVALYRSNSLKNQKNAHIHTPTNYYY